MSVDLDFVIELKEDAETSVRKDDMCRFWENVIVSEVK
jgi:hypothetical protein